MNRFIKIKVIILIYQLETNKIQKLSKAKTALIEIDDNEEKMYSSFYFEVICTINKLRVRGFTSSEG